MLSILLPIYNWDIRPLVRALHRQATEYGAPFEIICLDDASPDAELKTANREIAALGSVRYEELSQNIGRSQIRNLLAEKAIYPYLLFMDCDTMPISEAYLRNYLEQLHPERVLYGGRVYSPEPPSDAGFYFHWGYGRRREQQPALLRQTHPYKSFMTNNFLIPKAVFSPIGFEPSLRKYGHEDTLFGLELQRRGVGIVHLDNPLEHIGLEKNLVFLRKSEQALENLLLLAQSHDLGQEIRVLNVFRRVQAWRLGWAVRAGFWLLKPLIVLNLQTKNPSLRLFDFYKLGYLCRWAAHH